MTTPGTVTLERPGFLRAIAEKVLGPLVITRTLPRDSGAGKLVVSARVGGLKYLFKRADAWDPPLLRAVRLLVEPGDIVWDIGANVGLFSLASAWRSGALGRVYALEADADAQTLLYRSIALSAPDNAPLTLLGVAASDHVGWETFAISARARAANSIAGFGSSSSGGVAQNRTVPALTLDSLLEHYPGPAVLKIDVEGAELKVLQGSTAVLARCRPRLYCEVAEANREAIGDILQQHAYCFRDIETCFSHADIARGPDRIGFNTVAVPRETLAGYTQP